MTRAVLSFNQTRLQRPYSIAHSNRSSARWNCPDSAVRSAIASARAVYPEDVSRERKRKLACKIWAESAPLAGTPGEAYLAALGVKLTDGLNDVLRMHQAVLHEPTRVYYPALIASVRDAAGQFRGVLRTYLRPEGTGWERFEAPRMLGDCFGAFVQLSNPESFRIVLASSLETALIVRQACPEVPVWSSMTRGNMKAVLPLWAKEIVFCVEEDEFDPLNARRIVNDAIRAHEDRGQHVRLAKPPVMERNAERTE